MTQKYYSLNRTNGHVEFKYDRDFEQDGSEYLSVYGKFPLHEYKKGIDELVRNGECKIQGIECSLALKSTKQGFQIDFWTKEFRNGIIIYDSDITIDYFLK